MAIVVYVKPDDYADYGIPSTTSPATVLRASLMVDAYLDRPDGLLYSVDEDTGLPVYMEKTGQPIIEEYSLPLSQRITLSYTPLVAVLGVMNNASPVANPNFQIVPISGFSFTAGYSDLWIPYSIPRNVVRVSYIGGWTYETLPSEIKMAVATIANNLGAGGSGGAIISGNVTKFQAGGTAITFGGAGSGSASWAKSIFIDNDTARMLSPWKRNFR
jgi:hypothetical protein